MDDSRYRSKLFLDTYTVAANVTMDDDSTPLTTQVMYAKPNVPLPLLYFGSLNYDAIATIGAPVTSPMQGWNHSAYKYKEQVPISLFAVDKDGLTAQVSLWKYEQEIRRLAETYFNGSGSLRVLSRNQPGQEYLGGFFQYQVDLMLEYWRSSDVVPTAPAVSWGDVFIYDGDHLSGGVEGAWTGVGTGTFSLLPNKDWLDITDTDGSLTYMYNATALSLSTTVYPYIRFRYACSNADVKARVVVQFSDTSIQTVMADTNNYGSISVVKAALTPSKTVNNIIFYADSAVGDVYFDFAEIYGGDYIFPNCVTLNPPERTLKDASLFPPGSVGDVTQALGEGNAKVGMTFDLDISPTGLDWMRPQTSPSKTDYDQTDIFEELMQSNASNQLWHWLDYGQGAMKARLTYKKPMLQGTAWTMDTTWAEYMLGSKSSETYVSRFGKNV